MRRRHPTASLAFSIGLVAALFAMCLRLMAPAGWMPVATGDGVMFTLCSGSGSQQVALGKDSQTGPDTGAAHQGTCAFNSMGTPALPDLPPAVALVVFAVFVALGLAATPLVCVPAIGWLRPPLRGPPLRA